MASLRRSKLLTSLSMNDIDTVGNEDANATDGDFTDLPARSDSMFSLYHIDIPLKAEMKTTDLKEHVKDNTLRNVDGESSIQEQPKYQTKFHIRSSIELSKTHFNEGRRKKLHRNPSPQQEELQYKQQGMLHFRKKSINRSRSAMLKRFQGRCSTSTTCPPIKPSVLSIEALKEALSQSPMVYLDNGDVYPAVPQEKTVFVSEYI